MSFSDLLLIVLDTTSGGRHLYEVATEFRFASCLGIQITVPAGFQTDFASVPRLLWRILPPTGSHSKAAVVHDWLYSRDADCPRFLADAIFRHAMEISGVPLWKRWTMWAGVRIFGWICFRR